MRLVCSRCSTPLAPAWTGLRCPRFSACGRGGLEEVGRMIHPLADHARAIAGVRA